MANNITRPFVEKQLENLNRKCGMPLQPYQNLGDGNGIVPQAGCYHLDNAYGGYSLVRMSLTEGETGTTSIGNTGYVSLKVISMYIRMFSEGYTAALEAMHRVNS